MSKYSATIEHLKNMANRHNLEKLIQDKIYDSTLQEIKQTAIDKGYTTEWLKEQIVYLNKVYLEKSEIALADYKELINKYYEQYNNIKNTNYGHNFSATDYADLQFLQTLIKSRILNEGKNQAVFIERILNDYIHTQKGARAISFLVNDEQIGQYLKSYYDTAYANSQSVAEKTFNTNKKIELDKLGAVISEMNMTVIIGGANLKSAKERVDTDNLARINSYYFQPIETPQLILTTKEGVANV